MSLPSIGRVVTVQLCHRFAAPRERVFLAWTDARELARWFRPPGGAPAGAEVDLRVGGSFRIEMRYQVGPPIGHACGEYLEIDPPRRLVFTLRWEGTPRDPGPGTVTVEFVENGIATDVVFTHEITAGPRWTGAFHRRGWKRCFARLDRALRAD